MLKNALFIAIGAALVAGQASAVELYKDGELKVDVTGAAEVQVYKFGDADVDTRLDDGFAKFTAERKINDQFSAIGGIKADIGKSTVLTEELYVGLKSDKAEVTVGRQYTVADNWGWETYYELGKQAAPLASHGDDVIKVTFDNDQFWAAGSIELAENDLDEELIDLGAGATFGNVSVVGYYQVAENVGGADYDFLAIRGEYTLGNFVLGASYATVEDVESSMAGTATFKQGKNTFNAGLELIDQEAQDEDVRNIYGNVTHTLNDNVKVYSEVGYDDLSEELSYLAGMEVKF